MYVIGKLQGVKSFWANGTTKWTEKLNGSNGFGAVLRKNRFEKRRSISCTRTSEMLSGVTVIRLLRALGTLRSRLYGSLNTTRRET